MTPFELKLCQTMSTDRHTRNVPPEQFCCHFISCRVYFNGLQLEWDSSFCQVKVIRSLASWSQTVPQDIFRDDYQQFLEPHRLDAVAKFTMVTHSLEIGLTCSVVLLLFPILSLIRFVILSFQVLVASEESIMCKMPFIWLGMGSQLK